MDVGDSRTRRTFTIEREGSIDAVRERESARPCPGAPPSASRLSARLLLRLIAAVPFSAVRCASISGMYAEQKSRRAHS